MLLFTVGAGKKPGESGHCDDRLIRQTRVLNENYLLPNLKICPNLLFYQLLVLTEPALFRISAKSY